MDFVGFIDVEVHNPLMEKSAQAKFLVHGYDDLLWTDDPEAAAQYVKESIMQMYENRDK